MSDIGKLQRPEASAAMDASELASHEGAGAALEDPAAARERAGGELTYRASGGARGVAPMQRLMDERRAMGGKLAARVQRKGDGAAAGNVAIPESGGAKLPGAVRAKMEPKLGADLSDVKVHTSGESAQAASGLGARAFTVGSDVHFNAGEFSPGSKEGDRLLAHELTHVVQGKKSGVQRKADEDGGGAGGGEHGAGEKAGAEVSHPDEPAEKEADAVADGVADQLHGAEKGAKGKDNNKAGKEKNGEGAHGGEHGAAGDHGAAFDHGPGGGHDGPAEKPAPISAKFVGVGRKIMRAKGDKKKPDPAAPAAAPAPAPPTVLPGSISGVSSTSSVVPTAKKSDPLAKFTGSKGKYDANFNAAKANMVARGGTPEQGTLFDARKEEWFSRWGSAALSTDSEAAKAQFVSIQADLKTMFPDDKPSKDGGHLYSGYSGRGADAGSGRQRAEQSMGAANAKPENKAAGITHRTLETTLVGSMFDGVANDMRGAPPAEQAKWIPYGKSEAANWWSQISASYADTFVGEVHCHVDIGFPYFVGEMAKKQPSAAEARKPEKIAPLIALQSSVFRDDELPRVAKLMGLGKVTKCTFELRIEVTGGVFKTASPSIPAAGISTGAQLIAAIDAQLRTLVTPTELAANIVDPAGAPSASASSSPASSSSSTPKKS